MSSISKNILIFFLIQKVHLCTPPSFINSRNYNYYPSSHPTNKFVNGITSASQQLFEDKKNDLKSIQVMK